MIVRKAQQYLYPVFEFKRGIWYKTESAFADILDIEGSSEQIGKPQGTDIAANKPTYPAIMGLAQAKVKAQSLCDEALAALADFDSNADPLRSLAHYIIQRSQ